jgi:U6 snRNA-associated Sm-like protein LSm8
LIHDGISAQSITLTFNVSYQLNFISALRFSLLIMADSLSHYVDKVICIICNDGRVIVGVLRGFDQLINIILEEAQERVYSMQAGIQQVILGIYIIRGDNVALIGEINEEKDLQIDFNTTRAQPIKAITH